MATEYLSIHLNPLAFFKIDEPFSQLENKELSLEDIFVYICTPGENRDIKVLEKRYKEISRGNKNLFAAPNEERILQKLIWPLRHAKSNYMLGNYIGTIALCGMVAEMISILLFEISEFRFKNRQMTNDDQKAIFGSAFEKLPQERRVKILCAYDIVSQETKKLFDLIRVKRNRYLHLWSQDIDNLSKDSIDIFNATLSLVVELIGQDIVDGKIVLRPAMLKYLKRKGLFTTEIDND